MEIRKLIQKRMQGPSSHFFARDGREIPWFQVQVEYQAIRNYLGHHHNETHDVLTLKATKDYRFFLTLLAALELGIPYVPMMADFPQDRVNQIKEDAEFTLLITDELLEKMVKTTSPAPTYRVLDPDNLAYVLFTSGSTGKPKGVCIPRRALHGFFSWVAEFYPTVNEKDHLLQVTEFTFDISLNDVGHFLHQNVQMHFSDFKNDFFRLAYEIEENKINLITTVPNNLSMILSDEIAERANLTSLKMLNIAGARFSHGLYNKCFEKLGKKTTVNNLYGPTECTVYSHGKRFTYEESRDCSGNNVAIGDALPAVQSVIVKDGKKVTQGEQGELLLSGSQLLLHYMKNPEKTREVLMEFEGKVYYRTGDIAYQDEKNQYYIVGRMDDTIKCRGFRVNLLDIDSYINRLPFVEDCATIAIPHEVTENQTIAFIRVKEPKTVKELKTALAEIIPTYQIPEKIIFVTKYPTNDSGKIDKKTLKAEYLKQKENPV